MDLNEKIAARRAELQSNTQHVPNDFGKKVSALGVKDQITASSKPNQLIYHALIKAAWLRMPSWEKWLFIVGFLLCISALFSKGFSIFHFLIIAIPTCFFFKRKLDKYTFEVEAEIRQHGTILESQGNELFNKKFIWNAVKIYFVLAVVVFIFKNI